METFLYIVFFISCIVLVGTVLLQPGKTDAGALFTSGVSSASLNPRGTASVLSKVTIIAATVFMLTALLLSLPALTGKVSVLQTQGENNSSSAAIDANSNSANSNANSNAEANTGNVNSSTDNSETKTDEQKEESKDDKITEEKSDKPTAETKDKADDKKEDNK